MHCPLLTLHIVLSTVNVTLRTIYCEHYIVHCTLLTLHFALYTLTAQYIVHFQTAYIYVSLSEVVEMKKACGDAHMKSILAIGELGSMENVYKVKLWRP